MKLVHLFSVLFFAFILVLTAGCGGSSEDGGSESAPQEATPVAEAGQQTYTSYCMACHQANGRGVGGLYPPLSQTDWVEGDKGRLIRLVLHGMTGEMYVNGERYNNVMTPGRFLSDEEIAEVLTFIRRNFGNDAEAVLPEEVAAVRAATPDQKMWQASELEKTTGIPGFD